MRTPASLRLLVLIASSFPLSLAQGACSSSSAPTEPCICDGVVFPGGVTIGGTCKGEVYVPGTTGYAVCEGGAWAYETSIPHGYTEDTTLVGDVDASVKDARAAD